jgi:hypothetical protein
MEASSFKDNVVAQAPKSVMPHYRKPRICCDSRQKWSSRQNSYFAVSLKVGLGKILVCREPFDGKMLFAQQTTLL